MATRQGDFSRLVLLGAFGNSGSIEPHRTRASLSSRLSPTTTPGSTTSRTAPSKRTIVVNVTQIGRQAHGAIPAPSDSSMSLCAGRLARLGRSSAIRATPPRSSISSPWTISARTIFRHPVLRFTTPFMFLQACRRYTAAPKSLGAEPDGDLGKCGGTPAQRGTRITCPYFKRDIWPILVRPNNYQWVMDFRSPSPEEIRTTPPAAPAAPWIPVHIIVHSLIHGENPADNDEQAALCGRQRQFLYSVLRQAGRGESGLTAHKPPIRMPSPTQCRCCAVTTPSPIPRRPSSCGSPTRSFSF